MCLHFYMALQIAHEYQDGTVDLKMRTQYFIWSLIYQIQKEPKLQIWEWVQKKEESILQDGQHQNICLFWPPLPPSTCFWLLGNCTLNGFVSVKMLTYSISWNMEHSWEGMVWYPWTIWEKCAWQHCKQQEFMHIDEQGWKGDWAAPNLSPIPFSDTWGNGHQP